MKNNKYPGRLILGDNNNKKAIGIAIIVRNAKIEVSVKKKSNQAQKARNGKKVRKKSREILFTILNNFYYCIDYIIYLFLS